MRKHLFVDDRPSCPDRQVLLAVIMPCFGKQALRRLKHLLEGLTAPTDGLHTRVRLGRFVEHGRFPFEFLFQRWRRWKIRWLSRVTSASGGTTSVVADDSITAGPFTTLPAASFSISRICASCHVPCR